LTLTANILGTDRDIKNQKRTSTTVPAGFSQNSWTLVYKQKRYKCGCWPTLSRQCAFCIC